MPKGKGLGYEKTGREKRSLDKRFAEVEARRKTRPPDDLDADEYELEAKEYEEKRR
jgi:hypothetical protein